MKQTKHLIMVAAILWFIMFSPWTAPYINFWACMSLSGIILIILSIIPNKVAIFKDWNLSSIILGIISAAILWGIFWLGKYLSAKLFPFAQGQIDSIYNMNIQSHSFVIALLLLFIIGPAEEIFWRGCIQNRIIKAMNKNGSIIAQYLPVAVSSLIYALVHIWSFNFMLIMAALVCGLFWGILYKLDGRLSTVIISHAIWDVTIFLIFPV